MHFPTYLSYKLGFLLYAFLLLGRKKVADHTYSIENRKIFLRENTSDVFILWETFQKKGYHHKGFEIKPEDTVVDIGGHIGIFSVFAAGKAYKGQVFAYEPEIENYAHLQNNKKLNNLLNLKIFNAAVTSSGGQINLHISSSNSGGHSIHPVDTKKILKVPSISLRDVLKNNRLKRIDYLKIDTEGSEYDIILNTPKRVFKKIDKIVIEYHDYVTDKNNHRQIIEFLESCNFKVSIKGLVIIRKLFKMGMILAKRG